MLKKNSLICEECLHIHKEDMSRIKEYILANPNCTIIDVHQNTGVSLKTIQHLIDDQRILINEQIRITKN